MSYIEREAAKTAIMNYISEQTVSRYASSAECKAARSGAEGAFNEIDYLPEADVVEVVRCRDCQFNVANMQIDENDGTDYSGEDIVCSYFMTDGMEENDYCSRGKRREE